MTAQRTGVKPCAVHPAVVAAQRVGLTGKIDTVDEIAVGSRRPSQVYRLNWASSRTPTIAKISTPNVIGIERLVYEQILSILPISSIRCYGTAEDGSGGAWLLLDEA